MSEEKEHQAEPDETKDYRAIVDEHINPVHEAIQDVGQNVDNIVGKITKQVDITKGEIPSKEELKSDLEEVALGNAPSTTSLGASGAIAGGALFGPAGAFLGSVTGAGIGFYRDLNEDRILLAIRVDQVPSDATSVPIDHTQVQNSGAIEHTVKGAVDADIDMDRAKNTITKTRDFDTIEDSLDELPSYSLPSESFPDVTYVEYDGSAVAVWLEEDSE